MSLGGISPSKRRDTDMMKFDPDGSPIHSRTSFEVCITMKYPSNTSSNGTLPSLASSPCITRMMSDFEVHIPDESSMHDFLVAFPGPEDTPYQGGVWKVHVTLPKEYPFKSPSIGFENRMYHPNVDEMSGSVCLDVINQTWSPMFDLVNIFKMFLPHLLRYPNPADPLNGEAASNLMRDPAGYAERIRECVRLHASQPIKLGGTPSDNNDKAGPRHSRGGSSGSGSTAGVSTEGTSPGGPRSSASNSSSSDCLMEMEMDDASSDVSELSDIEDC